MKILLATPYKQTTGGITRWAEYIVDKALEEKSESFVLDVLPMNDPAGEGTSAPQKVSIWLRLIRGTRTYKRVIRDLKHVFKRQRYDVLHIASSGSISFLKDLWMLRIARKHDVKTIVHCHFGRIPQIIQRKGWEWLLFRCVLQCATQVMVIDKASYDAVCSIGYSNVVNVPNPLSPDVVRMVEQADGGARIPRRILFAGHCIQTKGVYELVEACRQIPQVELCLLGFVPPTVKSELEQLANRENWLKIMGNRPFPDVIREMCQCDLFVLPTYTEGFPNVILESMACGCPIITTSVGAIPQMLEIDGASPAGICVPPRDAVALQHAIELLLNDASLKTLFATRAKKYVREKYSLESVWSQMVASWQHV